MPSENDNSPEKRGKYLSDEEIERLNRTEILEASKHFKMNADARMTNWDRYYGRELGNERPGRSKFITRDLLSVTEKMLPTFMRTFAAQDSKIEINIEGQPPSV